MAKQNPTSKDAKTAQESRLFVSQNMLDEWIVSGSVVMEGETLRLKDGTVLNVRSAVRFDREVAGGGDGPGLVGRVKDIEQITVMGGEHMSSSVVIGDNAYEVLEGFVCSHVASTSAEQPQGDLKDEDLALLAKFVRSR